MEHEIDKKLYEESVRLRQHFQELLEDIPNEEIKENLWTLLLKIEGINLASGYFGHKHGWMKLPEDQV